MSSLVIAVLVVTGSAIASVIGLLLFRKIIGKDVLRNHSDLAGHFLAVVGTLNAVLLGLVVLEAQTRFQQARINEAAESSSIADLRMNAAYLPEPLRSETDERVRKYIYLVINHECDAPASEQPNKEALKEFHTIWKSICKFDPANSREQNLQAAMISELSQSFDNRRFRITTGRHGIPPILWAVLITSSITTVVFTYFFVADSLALQMLMTALLSITLSMSILVVAVLGNPYSGDWKIRPEQFDRVSIRVSYPRAEKKTDSPIDTTTGAKQ